MVIPSFLFNKRVLGRLAIQSVAERPARLWRIDQTTADLTSFELDC